MLHCDSSNCAESYSRASLTSDSEQTCRNLRPDQLRCQQWLHSCQLRHVRARRLTPDSRLIARMSELTASSHTLTKERYVCRAQASLTRVMLIANASLLGSCLRELCSSRSLAEHCRSPPQEGLCFSTFAPATEHCRSPDSRAQLAQAACRFHFSNMHARSRTASPKQAQGAGTRFRISQLFLSGCLL
jgi:hypothetical protein